MHRREEGEGLIRDKNNFEQMEGFRIRRKRNGKKRKECETLIEFGKEQKIIGE